VSSVPITTQLKIRAFGRLGWVHEPNKQRDARETGLSERMAIANFKTFESGGRSPSCGGRTAHPGWLGLRFRMASRHCERN
jgi:hypothetical protein